VKDDQISFRLPNDINVGDLLAKVPPSKICDIKMREGRLEDAFLNLVEKK